MSEDARRRNRDAWNAAARAGGEWSRPVDADGIARARAGEWSIILTPDAPVPRRWFPDPMKGARVLALAGSGGQQAPVLAAAGADVAVLDLSEEQLALDRAVAERDGLELRLEQGDMTDLSHFAEASFDLVVNPCSTCFVDDVRAVWRECARVLRPGGRLMAGLLNPAFHLFDHDAEGDAALRARFSLPRRVEADGMIEFSHTLTDLIGGQTAAGLKLIDLYEDRWPGSDIALDELMACHVATLAEKP